MRPKRQQAPGKRHSLSTELCLEKTSCLHRLCSLASGEGFLPFSLAFILEKDIRYDKESSSL